MANIKSQMKRNAQNEKRRERNSMVKSSVRTSAKKLMKSIETEKDTTKLELSYRTFTSIIDTAAKKGVVPKNAAARKKSRLAKKINATVKKNTQGA